LRTLVKIQIEVKEQKDVGKPDQKLNFKSRMDHAGIREGSQHGSSCCVKPWRKEKICHLLSTAKHHRRGFSTLER